MLVGRAGVQPATYALGVRRSMHLSYRPAHSMIPENLDTRFAYARIANAPSIAIRN